MSRCLDCDPSAVLCAALLRHFSPQLEDLAVDNFAALRLEAEASLGSAWRGSRRRRAGAAAAGAHAAAL